MTLIIFYRANLNFSGLRTLSSAYMTFSIIITQLLLRPSIKQMLDISPLNEGLRSSTTASLRHSVSHEHLLPNLGYIYREIGEKVQSLASEIALITIKLTILLTVQVPKLTTG